MQKVEAAGGVLYRQRNEEPEILLIFRRGVWDLPKGKKEVYESFGECAVREVSEETGIIGPILEDQLTDTYHEYEEDGVQFGKTTRWYSMRPPVPEPELQPQRQEEIERLQWTPSGEAKQRVGFDNLVEVIEAFEQKGSRG